MFFGILFLSQAIPSSSNSIWFLSVSSENIVE